MTGVVFLSCEGLWSLCLPDVLAPSVDESSFSRLCRDSALSPRRKELPPCLCFPVMARLLPEGREERGNEGTSLIPRFTGEHRQMPILVQLQGCGLAPSSCGRVEGKGCSHELIPLKQQCVFPPLVVPKNPVRLFSHSNWSNFQSGQILLCIGEMLK